MIYIALAIFILTYALISIRRMRGSKLTRPTSALLGAALMIIFGIVTITQAIESIDISIIFLLIGMMVIVSIFQISGFFNWAVAKLVLISKTSGRLFIIISLSTAFLSALFLNDAVVLFYTPIILNISKETKINPEPFLLSEIFSANIGSVATEIGNPQNAYIAIRSHIPFFYYSEYMLPVSIVSLFISLLVIYAFYRNEMKKTICSELKKVEVRHPNLLYAGIATMIAILISFFFVQNIAFVPFIGASVLLFLTPLITNEDPRRIIKEVDWGIILFFVGLFIVLEGVNVSGILSDIMNMFNNYGLPLSTPLWYVTFVTILSNLVSNVPAVLLLSPITYQTKFWLALALSSTLAGNATIIGAAANIIVLEIANTYGMDINWIRFSRVGIPVTVITIALGTLILFLI
ncbi:MAG: SLC13 family permease [Thermoplasmata archaeon]